MISSTRKFTDGQKRYMYAKGMYLFRCPPVCTAFWNTDDWIKYIDAGNGWRPTIDIGKIDEQNKSSDSEAIKS